jgi:adenine phosphoribosyltransferase
VSPAGSQTPPSPAGAGPSAHAAGPAPAARVTLADELAATVSRTIRDVADYPRPGVVFKDITPVLADGVLLGAVVAALADPFSDRVDTVVAIEARGFILGAPIALALGAGFVPVRKAGKLPGPTIGEDYALEYGTDRLELHRDALGSGRRILVVDDVVATGGTLAATRRLVERAGAQLVGVAALVELVDLRGRSRLPDVPLHVLLTA